VSAIVGGLEQRMTRLSGYVCCNNERASPGTGKTWGQATFSLGAKEVPLYFSHSTVLYAVNRGS